MPNSEDSHNNFKDLYNNQKVMYSNGGKDCVIVVEAACKATDCLGLNKAAGCDGLTVEHIIYSHESIVIILRTLFNIMLRTQGRRSVSDIGGAQHRLGPPNNLNLFHWAPPDKILRG